jgi:hypothetical protein
VNILSSPGPNQFSRNLNSGLYGLSNGELSVSKARVTQNGKIALPANAASGGVFSTAGSHTILLACSTFAENGKYSIAATLSLGRLVLQGDLIYNNHPFDGLPLTSPQIWKVNGLQQTRPGMYGS